MFVDTPMKVGNPEWKQICDVATDITLRNRVGASFDPADAASIVRGENRPPSIPAPKRPAIMSAQ